MARAAAVKQKPMKGSWSLDWNIPVAGIFAMVFGLIGQALFALNWAERIEYRVTSVEQSVVNIQPQGDRLTRVEAKLDSLTENVKDIKAVLLTFSPKTH